MANTLPTIRVTAYDGDRELFSSSFQRDVINIGKLARAQIRLEDSNVSRMHAVIEVTAEGKVEIADLNSTNGTYVNGEKVSRTVLHTGDQVRVGDIRLTVDIIQSVKRVKRAPKVEKAVTPLPKTLNPEHYLLLSDSSDEEVTASSGCVEIIRVWNGTIQDAFHVTAKTPKVTIGTNADNQYVINPEFLGDEDPTTLIQFNRDEPELHLSQAFQGKVKISDEVLEVDSARQLHGATVPLTEKVRAVLYLGKQAFLISYQNLPPKPRTSFYQKLDLKDQAYTILSIALHALFLFLLYMVPEEELIADRDHSLNRDMLIRSIQVAEIERQEEKEQEEIVEEKQEIKVEKVARKNRPTPVEKKISKINKVKKKQKENLTKEERQERDKEIAKDTGILKAMNDESLSLLNDPAEDLLDPGELSGVIIASADPNAPTTTSFQAFAGKAGPNGGGGETDFMLPQGSVASGSGGTKGMVSGLDKSAMAKDAGVGSGKLKERNRKVKVDILTPEVSGSYDKEAVRRVIRGQAGAIRWCYQQALQRNPKLGGKVVLAFLIAPTGGVKAPKIKSNTMPDPSVGECIAKKSRLWKFPPPPDSGVVKVSYPFLFKAKQ